MKFYASGLAFAAFTCFQPLSSAAQCDGLLAATPAEKHEQFGYALALSGATLAVGAPSHDGVAGGTGGVIVFDRSGAGWAQAAVLIAPDGAQLDQLGFAVALDGDVLVAGAPGDSEGTSITDIGAAYVFERGPGGWVQAAKLTASDALSGPIIWAADLGWSVTVSGATAVVGAPGDSPTYPQVTLSESGSAYVFERTPTGWVETAKLFASDGDGAEQFGIGVSLDGDTLAVGAFHEKVGADRTGAVYVFDRTPAGWVESTKLVPQGAADGDEFGQVLDLEGDTLLVAADNSDAAAEGGGAVYVYERTPGGWVESALLTAGDATANDHFGRSVALSGNRALIGADNAGLDFAGAAYLFERTPSGWVELEAFPGPNGPGWDLFGSAVALDGSEALVGERYGDSPALNGSGVVHLFGLGDGPCLSADAEAISVAAGGVQTFTLDASQASPAGGDLYFVLGTAGPTDPPIPVDGHALPLTPDGYFTFTVLSPNVPPFANTLGVLDGTGFATASLTVPPASSPSLIGVELHHAALILPAVLGGAALGASNAVPLALQP